MTDIGGGNDRRTGRRAIEGLSGLPWAAHFLGHALQVAPRHIDADGIAENVIERVLRLDLLAARTDGDDQLDLVVGLLGQRGIGKLTTVLEDRIGRLLKEKRRLALVGAGGLSDVVQIVAADAIDAAHRKPFLVADDRQ